MVLALMTHQGEYSVVVHLRVGDIRLLDGDTRFFTMLRDQVRHIRIDERVGHVAVTP